MLNSDKKELILKNIPMVKHFASKFYIDDFNIDYNSLFLRGTKGLLNCVDEFNSSSGVKFLSVASNNVKLEILDEIRRMSSFTTDDILQVKNYCKEVLYYTFCNNSTNNDEDDFNINFDTSHYNNIKNKCLLSFTAYLDDFLFDSKQISLNTLILDLNKNIDTLSHLEKLVLYLFYKEELNYYQISSVLNVSSDLIFNIHVIGLSKIRELIKIITN